MKRFEKIRRKEEKFLRENNNKKKSNWNITKPLYYILLAFIIPSKEKAKRKFPNNTHKFAVRTTMKGSIFFILAT